MSRQSVGDIWEQLKISATPKRPLNKKPEKSRQPAQATSSVPVQATCGDPTVNPNFELSGDTQNFADFQDADSRWEDTDEEVDRYIVSFGAPHKGIGIKCVSSYQFFREYNCFDAGRDPKSNQLSL